MSPDDLSKPQREQPETQVPLEEVDLIVSRIAGMRSMSATKRLALAKLSSLSPSQQRESIQPLIASLGDPSLRKWRDREVAAWTLGRTHLEPEDRDAAASALMDVLERAAKEPRFISVARIVTRWLIVGFLVFASVKLVDHWAFHWEPFIWSLFKCSVVGSPISLAAWIFRDKMLTDRARIAAANALGNLGIPETVGTLAGALRDGNRSVRVAAAEALHNVLTTITEDHFGAFGAQTIENLARGLTYPDGRLIFKILEALEKVGTGVAVPYVEKLYRSGRTVRVRDAADKVLGTLKARQHRESQSDRLLRSAVSPADPSEILLRPPAPGNDAETVRLLRSSIEEMN